MKSRTMMTVMILGVALLSASPGRAYELPLVNLGITTFLDGRPPAGPGFYFSQYLQLWQYQDFTDNAGNSALSGFADEDLTAWVGLSQFIYQSDQPLLGNGKWGMNLMIPEVGLDLSYGTDSAAFPQDNGSGLGDILVGPFHPVGSDHGAQRPDVHAENRITDDFSHG